jgi:serine/threonine-protein kinase HipA
MSRAGNVFYAGEPAGRIERRDDGRYLFAYRPEYLARSGARAVSLTLPLRSEPFESPVLFPFFSGLLAEGNLKELQCRLLRIDPDDDFTRLLKTTRQDVVGAVTVEEEMK